MKKVKAMVFKQKGATLYVFTMNAIELEPLCFVEAATRDKQKGLQRVTEPSRLREIADYVTDPRGVLPNNIVLNLKSNVLIEPDSDGNTATITFPSDEGDYAFVVDGQHRLFSFKQDYRKLPTAEAFELPVVAFYNASDELVGATFVAINVNQKPVNRDLITQMRAILGLLDDDAEKSSTELIHALDNDPLSPLFNRILRYPGERNKWVKVNQLLPVVKGILSPGAPLYEKTQAERKRLLINYLGAVSKTFPSAWADDKTANYSLLQPSSLQMLLGLMPDVMRRCDFYEHFSYTDETFKRQLQPLADLVLIGGWKKTTVEGLISTSAQRKNLLGQLREALRVRSPGQA